MNWFFVFKCYKSKWSSTFTSNRHVFQRAALKEKKNFVEQKTKISFERFFTWRKSSKRSSSVTFSWRFPQYKVRRSRFSRCDIAFFLTQMNKKETICCFFVVRPMKILEEKQTFSNRSSRLEPICSELCRFEKKKKKSSCEFRPFALKLKLNQRVFIFSMEINVDDLIFPLDTSKKRLFSMNFQRKCSFV